ncbi:MAG: 16S rRNA (adenine(1518)-N(6)/adenine(1519)-N(6))-dimethyltransferase RsmA [Oscillospiraceae bacterium]|jgi:16S rRNA (adenine1518-N6/adenine1519-N6)-dimethyltransferase|nr:16S rRNA (adenine(1518)-N(6)/adenine(1519)-N(6))-dimethyltransferase RsmA [Oscillospiraceae bacterium]
MKNLPDDFRFSKAKGQNFLRDASITRRIAESASIDGADVLEIGAGAGALTVELARRAAHVLTLEVDRMLIAPLNSALADANVGNVTVLNLDALKCELPQLLDAHFGASSHPVLCANLPYAITTPLLSRLLELRRFPVLTVMVQLEVAQRICAEPSSKEYGAFSVFAQYHSSPRILFMVPPSAFVPRPKVHSAVVRLDAPPRSVEAHAPDLLPPDEAHMFRIVRAAFQQRRKTLQNALCSALGIEKARVADALTVLGHPPDARGETLSVAEFIALADTLKRE